MIDALSAMVDEKINVLSLFHKANGEVRSGFVCTRMGTEINLDADFISKYEVEEIWNLKRNDSGCVDKCWDYKITDKITNKVVLYQQ